MTRSLPSLPSRSTKRLALGCCLSGAKFTPRNHRTPGQTAWDTILRGDRILTEPDEMLEELRRLRNYRVSYAHWHARNPMTREQTADPDTYATFGMAARQELPDMCLSYGASRNGPEVHQAIARGGEWQRTRHAGLTLEQGGAEFVTLQAAAELAIVIDLERQGFLRFQDSGGAQMVRDWTDYRASRRSLALTRHGLSDRAGFGYGKTSASIQLANYRRAIHARGRLPMEVEYTQFARSHALTKLALREFGLGASGRLNVAVLFGFSPRMAFPLSYGAFRSVIRAVRSLAGEVEGLNLSISVGAAVLPSQVTRLTAPLDVSVRSGQSVPPLVRLIAYACQPDSDVDLLRVGLEDQPFLLDSHGRIQPASNLDLVRHACEQIEHFGGVVDRFQSGVVVDPKLKRGKEGVARQVIA